MKKIKLPLDTKSLYFNIKNDNLAGHTATVATPVKKKTDDASLENIYLLKNKEVDILNKTELVSLLIKHSKTMVLIKKIYVFTKISVNGMLIDNSECFGCYIKEEIDNTKIQYGRLKLHYPSKFVYSDEDLNINNKNVYKLISEALGNYAFLIRYLEYDFETDVLNFDALILGENGIPYSKVFINEKGVGNKFNYVFNENADDYDREIIPLKRVFGEDVNPYNYIDYFKKMKNIAFGEIVSIYGLNIEVISYQYPYSLFDFCYYENGIKKYGILRVTATKNKYFNISMMQKAFMLKNKNNVNVFLVSDIFDKKTITIYSYESFSKLLLQINSMKYEDQ